MKQHGSFACLNGKVDLSTYEAQSTYQHWSYQLSKLRQETSLRLFTQELNMAASPAQSCRVLARRNGECREASQAELIIGSSITGVS